MPRDGSLTLSDVRNSTLSIVWEPCAQRGRYNVDKLMAEHGDAKLTDLLVTLANCEKAHSVSVHDRCKARYTGSSRRKRRLARESTKMASESNNWRALRA
jgi:hypothetical protein